MSEDLLAETRAFWDRVADDWLAQVGDDGDTNRVLNSDPVLWRLAGDVRGRASTPGAAPDTCRVVEDSPPASKDLRGLVILIYAYMKRQS